MLRFFNLILTLIVVSTSLAQGNSTNLESFEGLESQLPDCWSSIDGDGDGENWTILENDPVNNTYIPHTGLGLATSASWNDDPLSPNNFLILPQLNVQESEDLSWWVAAIDPSFTAENYAVVLSTTGTSVSDFSTTLFEETLSSVDWEERSVSLADYYGQTVFIAFRHYDVSDQFEMKLDDITYPTTVEECLITTVSIDKVASDELSFSIFPNPATDVLNVSVDGNETSTLMLFNNLGQVVYQDVVFGGNTAMIDVAQFESGVYSLSIQNDKQSKTSQVVLR